MLSSFGFSQPKLLDLCKNSLLADKDNEEKEASQNVAGVHQAEEDLHVLVSRTRLPILAVDEEMNAFNDPENAQDKKKLEIQSLES